jgi:BolA protein
MIRIDRIKKQLETLKPHFCEIIDESHKHANHTGGITESHYAIKIFADAFIGKSLLSRHRMIYQLLSLELASGLHALSIDTSCSDLPNN